LFLEIQFEPTKARYFIFDEEPVPGFVLQNLLENFEAVTEIISEASRLA
jgi:hypothetical protein